MTGESLTVHADHWPWSQVGVCVYCGCGRKLHQGSIPKDQESARAFLAALEDVILAAQRMLERKP